MEQHHATFVVIGGGIAGVSCIESLSILAPDQSVILISASPLVKNVSNVSFFGKTITKFDVVETEVNSLKTIHSNLNIISDVITFLNTQKKVLKTATNISVSYKYLCICTGGIPKLIAEGANIKRVLGIRDTESVKEFQKKLQNGRRMVVIGNGGIASEIIYATKGIDITWVIKDDYISSTFIDPGAAEFFQASLSEEHKKQKTMLKRQIYSEGDDTVVTSNMRSAALGPDWCKKLSFCSFLSNQGQGSLNIIYKTDVQSITEDESQEWPLVVSLKNGNVIECDFVISATGVEPALNFECDMPFDLQPDGGISVNEFMESSHKDVYAAGDVASAAWEFAPHWFQMRLWTQARQMGSMAAKAMHSKNVNEEIYQDFCFELFTHSTNLYGYQVILLGKFNGQGLGNKYEILIRTTPKLEYIKFVFAENKLQGAILIGETGLEEMCENLVLNQLDLSPFGDDILNPDIDIDDYFD